MRLRGETKRRNQALSPPNKLPKRFSGFLSRQKRFLVFACALPAGRSKQDRKLAEIQQDLEFETWIVQYFLHVRKIVSYYCVHKCWRFFVNNSDLNIPGSLNNSDLNIPASLNNSDSWIWIKHEFEFEQTTTRNKKFVQLSETSLNNSAKQVWIIQWSGFE